MDTYLNYKTKLNSYNTYTANDEIITRHAYKY